MQLITISPVLLSSGFPPALSPSFIFFIILVLLIAKSLAGVKFPNETLLHAHAAITQSMQVHSLLPHRSDIKVVEVKSTREVTGRRFNLILHTARVMALFFARHRHAFRPLMS